MRRRGETFKNSRNDRQTFFFLFFFLPGFVDSADGINVAAAECYYKNR